MALTDFARQFDNAYQEIFPKVLVGMKIANTRLLSELTFGQSVDRVRYDISAVDVQSRVPQTDGTVDVITDERETLEVDQDKMVLFNLSQKEMVQAGPLSPGTVIGGQVAIKLATYVDADILALTRSAFADFDTGSLTTLNSNGTPITLNSTTVPQMVSRLPAMLRRNNQNLSNLALVIDSIGISDMFQYLLGKNADFVNALFQNGYVNEQVASAEVYVSENLTSEAVLYTASNTPATGDTVTINGVVFTFKTTPSAAGEVLINGADDSRINLVAAVNGATIAGNNYVELTAANRRLISKTYRLTAVNDSTADTMTITGIGSGRLTVSETFTDTEENWSKNFIHAYFGKKGAIDCVVQKESKMEMLQEPKQPGSKNISSTVIYGLKAFTDGVQKYLDLLIAA
jgi:hypothetical protein